MIDDPAEPDKMINSVAYSNETREAVSRIPRGRFN